MKEDTRTLSRQGLSVHSIAARHKVSVRYVQKLFEASGRTFAQFAAEERLTAAYKAFSGRSDPPISTIACNFPAFLLTTRELVARSVEHLAVSFVDWVRNPQSFRAPLTKTSFQQSHYLYAMLITFRFKRWKEHTMRRFGIGAVRFVMVLVSAGIVLTALVDVADAKQRYCRKEYCAKRAPNKCTGGFLGIACTPRVGKCLSTGVKVVKC
jgi:hypothetical protein